MRGMEGNICDIKWKGMVCPQKSQFIEKIYHVKQFFKNKGLKWNETHLLLQGILKVVRKSSAEYALHSWTLVGLLVLLISSDDFLKSDYNRKIMLHW